MTYISVNILFIYVYFSFWSFFFNQGQGEEKQRKKLKLYIKGDRRDKKKSLLLKTEQDGTEATHIFVLFIILKHLWLHDGLKAY